MNIKYVVVNNCARVFSNKGLTTRPLTDNLEEVLKQENKIELIEEEIEKNKVQIDKETENLEVDKKWIFSSLPFFLVVCFLLLNGSITKDFVMAFSLFSSSIIGFSLFLGGTLNYLNEKKQIKNMKMQNFFFEQNLENEKNYLQELKDLEVLVNQKDSPNLIDIDTISMRRKLAECKEKLNYYQKRMKKFYHMPLTEEFKKELYQNGIDAEIYEDYVEEQTRILKK